MNNQAQRIKMIEELFDNIPFGAIVETGTFRGVTTEFLANFGVPLNSIEVNERYYQFAKLRLRRWRNVRVFLGHSTEVLRTLKNDGQFEESNIFFYLDAHWYDDLPLKDELTIIFEDVPKSVIMIDDFQVPHDEGYGYDDYGKQGKLCIDYLKELSAYNFAMFFPSMKSEQETGFRRGCVVLSSDQELATIMRLFTTISMYGRSHDLWHHDQDNNQRSR